jgi:hypothetical protein
MPTKIRKASSSLRSPRYENQTLAVGIRVPQRRRENRGAADSAVAWFAFYSTEERDSMGWCGRLLSLVLFPSVVFRRDKEAIREDAPSVCLQMPVL